MSTLNFSNITNNCNEIINGTISPCVYVYGSEYIITSLLIIATCLVFITTYLLWKEVHK